MVKSYIASIIYRPPRAKYSKKQLPHSIYINNDIEIIRKTIEIINNRNLKLVGSLYISPIELKGKPCIIYLHGNASCQLEGQFLPHLVLNSGISVLCIDLSGSGNSDGENIGLGYFEKDDVSCSINFLKENYQIEKFFLWGRSMGATTALWCASIGLDLCGIVADSPFLSLKSVIEDLTQDSWFLWFLSKSLYSWIDSEVKNKVGYSMNDLNLEPILNKSQVPAFLIHGESDSFIRVRESRKIFQLYGSNNKFLSTCNGSHNTNRPQKTILSALEFIYEILEIKIDNLEFNDIIDNSNLHFSNVNDLIFNKK